MADHDRGQVTADAAEVYQRLFVPALLQEWAPRVADAAGIGPGQRVLDVACGTGVLARHAAELVGVKGSVTGLDINDGMLAVARRLAPLIDWRQGPAERLPFVTGTFDAVVSQFGLMFFENRVGAIREMARVLRPGGRLAVAVWDGIDHSPGYAALAGILRRLFGAEVARGLEGPFVLGDRTALQSLFAEAGLPGAHVNSATGTVRFESIRVWVTAEVRGWVFGDRIDDDQFEHLVETVERELGRYVTPSGEVSFAIGAHIVSART